MGISLSGISSGFDWQSVVEQLTQVERAPQTRLLSEQSTLQQRNNAYGAIKTQLGVLQNRIQSLQSPTLFNSRLSTIGDSTVLSATVNENAALGVTTFNFTQLATAASQVGTTNAGTKLNATNNVSALVLSSAAFESPITAGTFTVNGKQVTIATADTLQQVFDKISTATGGVVTGAYNNSTDKITLTGSATVVLGSATDTSNFLASARLYNNGTTSVASSVALGVIKKTSTLATANFTTAVSDGGAGAGQFLVNGVAISFNAGTDTVNDVMNRISNSNAGVTATYDSTNDRFNLVNKTTGDVGIALQDVTGNFLAASKLSTGTLTRGKNLLYTVNGGSQIVSQSNIVAETSSGVPGVTVTALKVGSTTVTVTSDTAKIKTAINDFVAEYNKAQALVNTNTASSTDAKGKITAGLLAGDSDANALNSSLRRLVTGDITGLTGSITRLDSLGFASNGNDDSLVAADATKLDAALASNPVGLRDYFTNATNGFALGFNNYLNKTIGETGTLVTRQANLTTQSKNIDSQVATMERQVLANKERLTASFIAMETAQASINQQLSYLTKTFG